MKSPEVTVELEVMFLPSEQGGRNLGPALNNQRYRPHLRVPPDPSMLGVEFVDGPEGPAPFGTIVPATVRLVYEPAVSYSALQTGCSIEIVEGARVVGLGLVVRR
jgi:hypothetical protein